MAIEHALTVLGWFENLTKDEVPPEHLWEDSTGLEQWFAAVSEKRQQTYGSGGGSSTAADSDSDSANEMADNDLARALRNSR